jgi:hypothetical protein
MGRSGVGHDHVQRGLQASVLYVQRAGKNVDGGDRLGHRFGNALWLMNTHQILMLPVVRTSLFFPRKEI